MMLTMCVHIINPYFRFNKSIINSFSAACETDLRQNGNCESHDNVKLAAQASTLSHT
jgi:hypothetical protein